MRKIFLTMAAVLLSVCTHAQISTDEEPISFALEQELSSMTAIEIKRLPSLNMDEIQKEDLEDEEFDYPPRFGYSHKVDYTLDNSGTWQKLPNGDKLWRLTLHCPDAKSINLLYDKFWIPEGGKFFLYSSDMKQHIGAFTSRNNKGDKDHVQGFATGLLYGDEIVLEYYQPKEVEEEAVISISTVVHGYRSIPLIGGFGQSCPNQVDVNCSEGQNWQNEKRAVAMIIVNGNRCGSGALINNTSNDNRPLFLTANHCLNGQSAQSTPDLSSWIFYWNYESSGCNPSSNWAPTIRSTSGATILSNSSSSDFALLELTEDPINLSNFTPYYLGWDCSGSSGTGGVGIHHPYGDVKKISTYTMTPKSTYNNSTNTNSSGNHWLLSYIETANGFSIPQEASSGSPLINSNHRVIGQLHSGNPSCSNPENSSFWYGKLSCSWLGGGSSYNRLKDWLDPIGTNEQSISGIAPLTISGSEVPCSYSIYYINNLPTGCNVVWSLSNVSSAVSSLLTQNSPIQNQCIIYNNGTQSFNTDLVAKIMYNGQVLKTLTKHVQSYMSATFRQLGATYQNITYPYISETAFSSGMTICVNPQCLVQISSPLSEFSNMTFSHTGATPSLWTFVNGVISVRFPYSTSIKTMNVTGSYGCRTLDFIVRVYPESAPIVLEAIGTEDGYDISLTTQGNEGDGIQSINNEVVEWNLDIRHATTGYIVYEALVEGNTISVNTSDWMSGVYIVHATMNGQEAICKIVVK